MKAVAPHDRPREKLERLGAAGLGDNELLALVLGTGSRARNALDVANDLLHDVGGTHGLTRVAIDDLHRVAGIGRARAAQVLAAVELGRRTLTRGGVERPKLRSPAQLAAYLLPLYGAAAVEQFGVVMLDTKHHLIRVRIIAIGTLDSDGRSSAGSVSRGNGSGRRGHRALSQSPVRRSGAERRRPDSDQPDAQRRHGHGDRRRGSHHPGRPAVLLAARGRRDPPAWLTACRERLLIRLQILTALYFDCFSGASGDMILGALIDAGVKLEDVRQALGSLAITPDTIWTEPVVRGGIRATKFNVRGEAHPPDAHHHHDHELITSTPTPRRNAPTCAQSHRHASIARTGGRVASSSMADESHRTLAEILCLIDSSSLSTRRRIERRISSPARRGRGRHPRHVARSRSSARGGCARFDHRYHGTVFALEQLGVDTIVSSPLNVGGGTIHSAHGRYPVPAPATARLLKGAPIYSGAEQVELVTPTGALLIAATRARSARSRRCVSIRIGYGAGTRDFPNSPNVLRVLIGELDGAAPSRRSS